MALTDVRQGGEAVAVEQEHSQAGELTDRWWEGLQAVRGKDLQGIERSFHAIDTHSVPSTTLDSIESANLIQIFSSECGCRCSMLCHTRSKALPNVAGHIRMLHGTAESFMVSTKS